jgi:hypothetical protein
MYFWNDLEKGALAKSMGRANVLAELMDISRPARCRNATFSKSAMLLQSLSGQASRRLSHWHHLWTPLGGINEHQQP